MLFQMIDQIYPKEKVRDMLKTKRKPGYGSTSGYGTNKKGMGLMKKYNHLEDDAKTEINNLFVESIDKN